MDQAIDHNELDELLRACGSNWNAGQVHGLLCSRLSVAGTAGVDMWASQVLAGTEANEPACHRCRSILDTLSSYTWRQLAERQSEFELLLPDDDESAGVRAAAMGYWCEGFLHGLVAEKHSEKLKKRLAVDPLADIIKDMLEITRITVGEEDETNDNEAAYAELVEYLRVATQITYEELADFRPATDELLPADSDTLH